MKNAKAGQVRYRVDKAGIVHCTIGKAGFEADKLRENLQALLADLNKAKPATSKGVYMKRVTLSSTMGPGVVIDQSSLSASQSLIDAVQALRARRQEFLELMRVPRRESRGSIEDRRRGALDGTSHEDVC